MKTYRKKSIATALILALIVCTTQATSAEEEASWSRKGKTELYGIYQMLSGETAAGSGVQADFSATNAYGLGVGTNLIDQLNLNFEFLFGSTDVIGSTMARSVKGDANYGWINLNFDYNILKYRLTPVIVGGFGLYALSGDFNGYKFSEGHLSYNLGIGARWDITRHIFAKALYRSYWSEIEDMGSVQFDGFTASLGFMF